MESTSGANVLPAKRAEAQLGGTAADRERPLGKFGSGLGAQA